jgi:hypothetical protein
MILERREPGDRLPPDLEGRNAVGDPLFGLGDDVQDRLPQPGQRRAFGRFQGIEIPVDLLSRHDPILMTGQLHEQGTATADRDCLSWRQRSHQASVSQTPPSARPDLPRTRYLTQRRHQPRA